MDLKFHLQKLVKQNVPKGLGFVVLGPSILIQKNATYILYPLVVINLASKLKLILTCLDTFVQTAGPQKTNVLVAKVSLARARITSLLPMASMPVLTPEPLALLRSEDPVSIKDSFGNTVREGEDGSELKAKLLD